MPRSGIAGSYSNSMFNYLRNCQSLFQSYDPIAVYEGLSSPTSLPALVCLTFWLSPSQWVGGVTPLWFVFISLLTNDVKYPFMCLLAIVVSWEKCLFRSFAHFFIELFVFLLLSCKNSLYTLDTSPLSGTWFANIFTLCVCCLCTVFTVSLAVPVGTWAGSDSVKGSAVGPTITNTCLWAGSSSRVLL